jgi:glycosyltransferase involved in cell wall biosynthesis
MSAQNEPTSAQASSPTISIVMTVFNRARFVEAAVRSVLTQTFQDFELIVIDDGSTDDSLSIVQSLAKQDRRIRFCAQEHKGLVAALIAGNSLTRGQLVGWVDSDDLLVDRALERCAEFLARNAHVDMVYTNHLVIDEHNRSRGLGTRCTIPYSPTDLLTQFMVHHFRLFRKDLWHRTNGVDPTLTTSPDYDFCLRASEVGQIAHLPESLYCYREHSQSVSTARRIEQIQNTTTIIQAAMVRRNMHQTHLLHVDVRALFTLVPRPTADR